MLRTLSVFLVFLASPGLAACGGTDLMARMPAAELAALRDRARQSPHAEGLLWQARNGDRVVHLVGTMHLYDPRHQAMLDRVQPLLEAADTVFLELGAGDEARLQAMIAEQPDLAFITEGPTLPDLLDAADWDRLRAALSERGVPGLLAAKMKPWMAMANLAITRCDFANLKSGKRGLDALVIDRAVALGKPPRALEPIETAFGIFGGFTQDEQIEMLRLALAQQAQDSADQAVTVTEAYFREEVQLIWEWSMHQAFNYPGFSAEAIQGQIDTLQTVLLDRRNTAWIEEITATPGTVLVAVGAMHLPGERGLLALLQARGYTVTRLSL